MDRLLEFESKIINFTGWPLWSCRSIEVLVSIVAVLSLLQVYIDRIGGNDDCNDKGNTLLVHQGKRHQFRMFQVQYLVVYITVMLADWLQGTNMYTLYAVRFCFIRSLIVKSANYSHMEWILVHCFSLAFYQVLYLGLSWECTWTCGDESSAAFSSVFSR